MKTKAVIGSGPAAGLSVHDWSVLVTRFFEKVNRRWLDYQLLPLAQKIDPGWPSSADDLALFQAWLRCPVSRDTWLPRSKALTDMFALYIWDNIVLDRRLVEPEVQDLQNKLFRADNVQLNAAA